MKTEITKKLEDVAIRWLYRNGCKAFVKEGKLHYVGGVADVLGIKDNGDIYYLEVKQNRADLISKKQKTHEANFENNFYKYQLPYDFRYFVLPDSGVEIKDGEYPNWGIIRAVNLSEGIKFPVNSVMPEAIVVRRAKRRKVGNKNLDEIWKYIAHTACMRAYRDIIYI